MCQPQVPGRSRDNVATVYFVDSLADSEWNERGQSANELIDFSGKNTGRHPADIVRSISSSAG
jgi:hypothetical protein